VKVLVSSLDLSTEPLYNMLADVHLYMTLFVACDLYCSIYITVLFLFIESFYLLQVTFSLCIVWFLVGCYTYILFSSMQFHQWYTCV